MLFAEYFDPSFSFVINTTQPGFRHNPEMHIHAPDFFFLSRYPVNSLFIHTDDISLYLFTYCTCSICLLHVQLQHDNKDMPVQDRLWVVVTRKHTLFVCG